MLVRALYLSAIWLTLSLFGTLILGTRWRRGNSLLSLLWLTTTIFAGNLIALFTFGKFLEVFGLSLPAFVFGSFWIIRLRDWNGLGQVTWSMTLMSTGVFILYAFVLTAFSLLNPFSFVFAFLFFLIESIALLLALAHMHESLDVMCRIRWHRLSQKLESVPDFTPMVSLHVPAYNEPLEVMQRTLSSLAHLNYVNYEVLVVDNNTPLDETWRPLEKMCRSLGPQFHCLHLDQWPGYKSGALNFAVAQTDPRAEIIGIIDADYQVDPEFLHELVPAFADQTVAFVQTPQDYDVDKKDVFTESTYHGYQYFFEVSMPSRNERNAIIFAGTMGLIRKSVLEEIGGWDEWCITEDAEASLRILKRGYKALYVNKAFGRGLMPFNFEGLKKQRFRWCFGGMQILKKHWEALMPWAHWVDPENKLTLAQRYYYLLGGLGWFSDLFNLLFALFLVLGVAFTMLSSPVQIRPLTNTILILPAVFLVLHLLRFLWVLRNRLKISLGMAVATMYNFFGLGWSVSLACIQGLIQKERTFLRTPKSRTESRIWRAIYMTQWESAIGLSCILAGLLVFITNENWRTLSLCALLFWQGSLYVAAPVYSLLSVDRKGAREARSNDQGRPVLEQSAARWVVALFMTTIGAFSLIALLPPPSQLPPYAHFLPAGLSPQQTVSPTRGPSPSATPATPVEGNATVSVESTYCWSAPGKPGKKLNAVFRGEKFQILGRNTDPGNPWWYVRSADTGSECWLWGMAVTTTGQLDNVPVMK